MKYVWFVSMCCIFLKTVFILFLPDRLCTHLFWRIQKKKEISFYLDEHFFFSLARCSIHFFSEQYNMNREIFCFNSIIFTSSVSRTPIELYINESKWMQQIYNTYKNGNTRISFSDHTNIISIQHSAFHTKCSKRNLNAKK